MKKWEYRLKPIIVSDLELIEFDLRWLGEDGWELAAILPEAPGKLPQAVFKRPKIEQTSN